MITHSGTEQSIMVLYSQGDDVGLESKDRTSMDTVPQAVVGEVTVG